MIRIISILFTILSVTLNAVPAISSFEMPERPLTNYRSVTERYVEVHGYENILTRLKTQGLNPEYRTFFEQILPHEEKGFFGYHSSVQGFRIFQDIIKFTLEELCDLEIKKDFHFLRVPGSPLLICESSKEFNQKNPDIWDDAPDQREQLFSLNYALYGNYTYFGCCTTCYFMNNHSNATIDYQKKLYRFFDQLGLPIESLNSLFEIGKSLMVKENAVLFQLFDFSHHNAYKNPYSFVDRYCYPASLGGPYRPLEGKLSDLYLSQTANYFLAELRLVINTKDVLNPYGCLTIKRYDRNDSATIERYESALREAIRALPYDPMKVKVYKETLLNMWGQTDV